VARAGARVDECKRSRGALVTGWEQPRRSRQRGGSPGQRAVGQRVDADGMKEGAGTFGLLSPFGKRRGLAVLTPQLSVGCVERGERGGRNRGPARWEHGIEHRFACGRMSKVKPVTIDFHELGTHRLLERFGHRSIVESRRRREQVPVKMTSERRRARKHRAGGVSGSSRRCTVSANVCGTPGDASSSSTRNCTPSAASMMRCTSTEPVPPVHACTIAAPC
jgi:hypothetical protein